MDIINIAISLTFVFNISLFVFFFVRSFYTKNTSEKYFAYLCFAISMWCISIVLFRLTDNTDEAIVWAKILYSSAVFTPLTFLIFALSFPNKVIKSWKLIALISIGVMYAVLILLTDSVIENVIMPNSGEKEIEFGFMYYLTYIFYIPLFFTISFLSVYNKIVNSVSIEKVQLYLILVGSFLSSSIAMITNLLLPTINIFTFNWLGQFSTIIWISAITYSILKYRLFDIKILLGRLTYILILASILFFTFYGLAYFHIYLFGTPFVAESYFIGALLSLIYVIFYDFFKEYIREKVTSNLINPGFDPKEELNKYNGLISTLLDKTDISVNTLELIKKTLRAEYEFIILQEENSVTIENYGNFQTTSLEQGILVNNFFEQKKEISIFNLDNEANSALIDQNILEVLHSINVKILVPLHSANQFFGTMIIGPKPNEIPFSTIETNFISDISETLMGGLARSVYYSQVQTFNQTLQYKVDEATDELKRKNKALGEALRKERDMLDILGHELRTPLGTARNAIMMLNMARKSEAIHDTKVDHYLKIATDNIVREAKILETILSSARIENDKLDLTFEQVDIDGVVNDAREAYISQAEKKGLIVNIEVDHDHISAFADRSATQQILDNLVSNAVKYTEEGSVTIFAHEGENTVSFGTKDTGEGIPNSEIKNLGKKFYRINPYLDSAGTIGQRQIVRPGGTGIGLFVVFNLIKNMKGTIDIQSEEGQGSTFTITLPKYQGQEKTEVKKSDVQHRFDSKHNNQIENVQKKQHQKMFTKID